MGDFSALERRIDERREAYLDTSNHTGLHITCELRGQARKAGDQWQALDGLLAWAVAFELTEGKPWMLREMDRAVDLPLPLTSLATTDTGTLYAAGSLEPESMEPWVDWTHRRSRTGARQALSRGKLPKINDRGGADQPRRTPVPTVVAPTWSAWCVGDAGEVERLLTYVDSLGPRRNIGYGEIARWSVESGLDIGATLIAALVTDAQHGPALSRPVPAVARDTLAAHGIVPSDVPTFGGWRAPYWHDGVWCDRWPRLTPVTVER